jgi:hypothetical protein
MGTLTWNEQVALDLVIAVHRGCDWTVWGTPSRRVRYWDALTERVKAATYAGPSLDHWWGWISRDLPSQPRDPQARADLQALLSHEDLPVLKVLRDHAPVLVLRTRVLIESERDGQRTGKGDPEPIPHV